MTRIKLKFIHEYHDANGVLRRYVRRRGFKRVPLPGLPGSEEFMRAYQEAIAGAQPMPKPSKREGTVGDLVTRYYGSPKFAKLSESSKEQYREQLDPFVIEHGHRFVRDLTADKAEKIITKIGTTRPGLANKVRAILSAVFRYAVKLRLRTDNPFSADVIDAYELGSYRSWTDGELESYRKRWPVGTRERLAFAVLLYTGQRVSDAIKLTRSDVFSITQKKTGAALKIPQHPALMRAIKAGPSNGLYILGDADGRPLTENQLSDLVRDALRAAGLPHDCKPHGLRKANQRLLAEAGATTKQMQAVSGHKTLRQTEQYSAQANQAVLATTAIALLPDEE